MHRLALVSLVSIFVIIDQPVDSYRDHQPCHADDDTITGHRGLDDDLEISRRIDEMSVLIQELERNITKYTERDIKKSKIRAMRLSVEKLEGSGCGKDQFRCGGLFSRCIPSFLVCDGYRDCENGEDEEECDALFTVGEEWICHVIYDHCSTEKVKDVYSTMKVLEHKVTPYFGSQAEVTVTFKASMIAPWIQTHLFGYCTGNYVYGLRALDYSCTVQSTVQMTCIFEGDNRNQCHSTLYRNGEICGRATWTKAVK